MEIGIVAKCSPIRLSHDDEYLQGLLAVLAGPGDFGGYLVWHDHLSQAHEVAWLATISFVC